MARVNSSDGAVADDEDVDGDEANGEEVRPIGQIKGFVESCKKVSRLWWRWRVNLKTLKP